MFRKFQVKERWKGELRVEAFNLTNTPAFANPNTQLGSTTFGRVTRTLAGTFANQSIGGIGPRVIQLGIKIAF